MRRLLDEAEPGSDHQLTFARAFAAAAHTDAALDDARGAARRRRSSSTGSPSTPTCAGRCSAAWPAPAAPTTTRIADELRRDNTISGQERAAAARAARPTAEAKAEAWEIAVVRDDVPNETQRSVVLSFMQPGQEEVLRPYVEKYLEVAETLWEEKGTQRASTALEFLFPRPLASPELLERVSAWLHDSTANTVRRSATSREGAADVERYLAGQDEGRSRLSRRRLLLRSPCARVLLVQGRGLARGLGELPDAVLDPADEVAVRRRQTPCRRRRGGRRRRSASGVRRSP